MSRPALIAIVGGLAVVIGAMLGSTGRAPVEVVPSLPTETSSSLIDVHVAGWVMSPGVVRLRDGAIVADAIEAAGGFRPGAQVHTINLAASVLSGDQVFVAGPGSDGEEFVTDNGQISINRATASELETLPGVGPVLAERIVAHREDNGPFQSVEDLLDVPGIGEAKLASMRDLIRVP